MPTGGPTSSPTVSVINSPDGVFVNFIRDNMRDLNDPLDDFGTVSLNIYGKVYIDSIINVENQNYFYLEDLLETELGGVPEDTRADMMAFFTMVQGVRSSER